MNTTPPALHTARCACGACSITVSGAPEMHGVCHCTNCKQRTGSAFGISIYFPRSAVQSQLGATRVYAFHHQAQNHDQARHFCERCGTTLFWTLTALPELIGIAGGCFGQAQPGTPNYSVSHAKKLPWLDLPTAWHMVME